MDFTRFRPVGLLPNWSLSVPLREQGGQAREKDPVTLDTELRYSVREEMGPWTTGR
jgi:hypothetical protein